ncbi:MAG: HAMP domain-containing histidine kinase, partial [Chloroflexi bacterium]|nr:HAMP domain-containing histidine kinase [Chloroflexota bacterium]
ASHEFRTPLSVILSAAELLENYGDEWDRPRKEKHYRRIEAGVQQMTQMLNDVLLIGKAEAGKIAFAPKPLNLTQLCRAIADEMRASVGAEHTLQLQLADQCADARSDEKLLRQILLNLLSNAFKYSPKGSTVKFDLACHDHLATFVIQDRGIGIPAPDQARLFDTFHRAKNVGNIPGTGLGLAIVKTSVELHGGTIQFESQAGGTKFVVAIPVSKK